MNLTIGNRIMGGFLVVIVLVAVMSTFTYFKVGELNVTYQQLMRMNMQKVELSQGIATDIANEAVAMRRFNFTGDPADIQVFNDYRKQANEKLKLLESQLQTEASRAMVASIKQDKEAYESIGEKSFEAKKANNAEQVGIYMQQAGAPYKKTMASAQDLVKRINENAKINEAECTDKANQVQKMLLIVNFLVAGIAICISIYISRPIARRMNNLRGDILAMSELDLSRNDVKATHNDEIGDMANALISMKHALLGVVAQVRDSSEALAASSEELTSTVEEQLRTSDVIANTASDIAAGSGQNTYNITEISAVIEEVTAGAEEMNASAAEVNNTTHKAVADTNLGRQLIQKVVIQNETIENSMKEITEISTSLVKGSSEIQEIITVISNIAGQTNLLALNAAIEAARAGEAGKGFAVVAEEVRKLAEQSAGAAGHIGDIIRKMTSDIDFSVNMVNQANAEVAAGKVAATDTSRGFENIVEKLGQVESGMEQIAHSIEETAKGMQAIVSNVQNISAVSEETSAGTQTVAAAAEEQNASLHEVTSSAEALAKMAADLNGIIRKFKV